MIDRPDVEFVAFFRNVNLGQPGSPTRARLESAFRQAGAQAAASFMSNGTLVFSAEGLPAAIDTAQRAARLLAEACGLKEPVFVCSLARLAALAAADPFAGQGNTEARKRCFSVFAPAAGRGLALPLASERGDCTVFFLEDGLALSVTRTVGGRTGYPTPVLEKALGLPVTTRGWNTILRLLARHAPEGWIRTRRGT